jgi:hypothetical protein
MFCGATVGCVASKFQHGAGFLYFVASLSLEIKILRNTVDEDAKYAALPALRLPLAALEATFAVAMLKSLVATISQIKSKGSQMRLYVYRVFAACMLTVALVCGGYVMFESYYHTIAPHYEKWQFEWVCPLCRCIAS